MRLNAALALSFVSLLLLVPATTYAQAEIAGTVRDSSGAVLPGVTVEAASPVLIEKVRSVVTDGTGQYRLVDLRPGMYTITFTLAGFNAVRRTGVELTGSATFLVNAEMRVGALEETITVTGEAPIVDVQNVTRQRVLDQEIIAALPTARRYYSLGVLIPGISSNSADVGGALGDTMSSLTIHGSQGGDQRLLLNGLNTAGLSGGSVSGVVPNVAAAQEVTLDTSAVSAELSQGGVRINFIPRDGGNTFAGSFFGSFSNAGMQGDNFTQRVRDRGLATPDRVERIWDVSPAFGGPIKRDRLWFWAAGMHSGSRNPVGGMFHNRNAFNPNAWTYEADRSRPAVNKGVWWNAQIRVTWQASPRNKIAGSYDQQSHCRCPAFITATRAPEAAADRRFPQQRVVTAEWTSPVTNRILVEAVGLHRTTRWMSGHLQAVGSLKDPVEQANQPLMIAVTEQSTGLIYRAFTTYNNNWNNNYFFRGSVSYITGAHALKVGFNNVTGFLQDRIYDFQPVSYRFNGGVPNQVTIRATPYSFRAEIDRDLGVYAQDRWTAGRLTLTLGVRYDDFASNLPEWHLGPGPLVPTRDLTFPAQDNLGWRDITYRSGASYDLFKNGRTALKVSLNKYLAQQVLSGLGQQPHPINKLVNSTNRSWNDQNRNFVPDCDLVNPLANGECGPMANRNFGTAVPGATYDSDLLGGWGNRNYNWEFSAGGQHEIVPRVSLDVGYFRRWFGNFRVTDDLLVGPSDFDAFSITAPSDSRLPGGGGHAIGGLYNINPSKFGQSREYNTLSGKYGTQIEHWNGVDVSVQARLQNGVLLSGGVSTGKRTTDNCEVVAKLPEMLFGAQNLGDGNANVWLPAQRCHQEEPFRTQVKFYGVYTIPRIDVLVSGTLQSTPGPLVAANWNASNAVVAPALGRALSGNAANMSINIVEPGSMYGERLNQLDFRVGKIFRYGKTRTGVNLDIYNMLNKDTVRTQNNTFGPVWQRPNSILLARFAKISATFDF